MLLAPVAMFGMRVPVWITVVKVVVLTTPPSEVIADVTTTVVTIVLSWNPLELSAARVLLVGVLVTGSTGRDVSWTEGVISKGFDIPPAEVRFNGVDREVGGDSEIDKEGGDGRESGGGVTIDDEDGPGADAVDESDETDDDSVVTGSTAGEPDETEEIDDTSEDVSEEDKDTNRKVGENVNDDRDEKGET